MNPTTNIDRMRVAGGTSPTAINGDHVLGATVNSRPSYVLASGIDIIWSGTYWEIRSGSTARWRSASPHGTLPSDVAAWTAQNSSTGTIAVTALSRGADELISAGTPATPDAAAELIAAGSPATPGAAADLVANGLFPASIQVSGTLTKNGTTPLVFPVLRRTVPFNGAPCWTDTGSDWDSEAGGNYAIYYDDEELSWKLVTTVGGSFGFAGGNDASPLQVDDWEAFSSETGTPTLAAVLLAPGEVIDGGTPATPSAPGELI
jgi:hypothetical protein